MSRRPNQFELDYEHILADGLVFAGLGNIPKTDKLHDSSFDGNNGTLTSMDPATDWVFDPTLNRYALDFDGTDDYIRVPGSPSFVFSDAFTASCWYEFDGSNLGALVSIGHSNYQGWMIYTPSLGTVRLFANGATWSTGSVSGVGWHHVAVQWDGSYSRLFLDGLQVDEDAQGTAPNQDSDDDLLIGGYDANFNDDGGTPSQLTDVPICDPCVWGRALSPAEISILANKSDPMLGGLIRTPKAYWPGISFTAPTHTTGIALASQTPSRRPDQFDIDVEHGLADGLVFFGGGAHPGSTHYHDSSPHSNDGTLYSTVWSSPVLGRNTVLLDGVDDYISFGTAPIISEPFTLAAWCVPIINIEDNPFFHIGCSGWAKKTGIGMYRYYSGGWQTAFGLYKNVTGEDTTCLVLDGSWNEGEAYHVCGVFTSTTHRALYVNGVFVAEDTSTDSGVCGGEFRVGRDKDNHLESNCRVADPVAHNRALSPAEIAILADPSDFLLDGLIYTPKNYVPGVTFDHPSDTPVHTTRLLVPYHSTPDRRPDQFEIDVENQLADGLVFAGLGVHPKTVDYYDSSPRENSGTLTSMDPSTDWVFDPELNRYALNLSDASSQYIDVANHSSLRFGTSNFSISAWVRYGSTPDNLPVIMAIGDTGADEWMIRSTNDPTLNLQAYMGAGNVNVSADFDATVWVHIALVRTGGTVTIYIDGAFGAEDTSVSCNLTSTKDLSIGAEEQGASNFWDGDIADPLIYNRALSPAEISILADPDPMLGGLIRRPLGIVTSTNKYWRGTTTKYSTPHNWLPQGKPTIENDVIFDGDS